MRAVTSTSLSEVSGVSMRRNVRAEWIVRQNGQRTRAVIGIEPVTTTGRSHDGQARLPRPTAWAARPARFQARRGDRPHGLHEILDVLVERREVPSRTGGDPPAERRELERLREVP